MKAIIIDDVATARETLQEDVATYCPDIEIIGTADGVVSGAKLLRELKPDLLFLDIELQDGTGFDVLEIVHDLTAKVIFTTASNAYAIKAFRFSATDYLLKPIDPDELMEAVEKAKKENTTTANQKESIDLLLESMKTKQTPRKLALHSQEKIHVANVEDIVRLEAGGNCTFFHFQDKSRLLVTKTLKEYDKMLSDAGFLRVHQSHLVNTELIKAYIKTEGGYLLMQNGERVPVSVRKKTEVMKVLDTL